MYKNFIHKEFYKDIIRKKSFCMILQAKGVTHHSQIKYFESVKRCMLEISNNPAADIYLLGKTMGKEHRDWRRSKQFLPDRYRLFFKYFSKELEIYYAWINDENTLRKEGAETDCYNVFKKKLESGKIPSKRIELQHDSTKIDINKL